MIKLVKNNRFLILRRFTQITIMLFFIAGNVWGWNVLQGNLSSSQVLGTIPLSDPFAVLQMFVAGGVMSLNIVVGALIVTIVYMLFGGRIFCSYVCPVNMITDAANFLRRKLNFNYVEKKQPMSRNLRYWILGLTLILSFVLSVSAFDFISPIGITSRAIIFGLGLGWTAMLVIFLFDLFVLQNGWCGHICPLGGFYSIVGKVGFLKVVHDSDKCTACMKCKIVCPEKQVLFMIAKESIQVSSGECLNCARCIEVCDDYALKFSILRLNKNRSE